MALFVSRRERRLWLWAAALMVAILSTLGLARVLAGVLRDRGLIDAAFAVGMVLVVAAAVVLAVASRPRLAEVGVALGIAAGYLLVVLRLALPAEERTHLLEYGVVALLVHEALLERARHRRVAHPALLAVLVTSAVGVLDECVQAFWPGRFFDYRDIAFNVLAALMAVVARVTLDRFRRSLGGETRGREPAAGS